MSVESVKDDVKENKNAIARLGDIIRGNGEGIGMRAQVKTNTDFIKEIKNYVRAGVLMFMGQGVIIIIWVIKQMN